MRVVLMDSSGSAQRMGPEPDHLGRGWTPANADGPENVQGDGGPMKRDP